jgi:taurine---2-oxoglutarate transaminase
MDVELTEPALDALQIEKTHVLHTWLTTQKTWNPPVIVGGAGSWFWDADGHRYLDLSAQAQCMHLGHQHPGVVAAIQQQAAELCFIHNNWGSPPRGELARRLIEKSSLAGGKVYFTLDGSEATEHAIKMARWITGRRKVIGRYRSYHGATSYAIALSGDARNWRTAGLPDMVHVLPPYCYRCPFGLSYPSCNLRCAGHIGDIIEWEGPDTVAAVFVEPVVGTNGLFAGPGDYWRQLRTICDKYGILLVADEVMTGFGRTGTWFGWQHWPDAPPDMMLLGKGLTAAHLPLGGVVLNQRCAAHFDDNPLPSGLTYAGHTLCCAAGVAAIDVYEREGLIQRSQDLGVWLFHRLRQIADRHPSVGDVRDIGLFAALELVVNRETRQPLAPWPQVPASLSRLSVEAKKRGVVLGIRGNLIILSPPLNILQEDLVWGLDVLDELLAITDAEAEQMKQMPSSLQSP